MRLLTLFATTLLLLLFVQCSQDITPPQANPSSSANTAEVPENIQAINNKIVLTEGIINNLTFNNPECTGLEDEACTDSEKQYFLYVEYKNKLELLKETTLAAQPGNAASIFYRDQAYEKVMALENHELFDFSTGDPLSSPENLSSIAASSSATLLSSGEQPSSSQQLSSTPESSTEELSSVAPSSTPESSSDVLSSEEPSSTIAESSSEELSSIALSSTPESSSEELSSDEPSSTPESSSATILSSQSQPTTLEVENGVRTNLENAVFGGIMNGNSDGIDSVCWSGVAMDGKTTADLTYSSGPGDGFIDLLFDSVTLGSFDPEPCGAWEGTCGVLTMTFTAQSGSGELCLVGADIGGFIAAVDKLQLQ